MKNLLRNALCSTAALALMAEFASAQTAAAPAPEMIGKGLAAIGAGLAIVGGAIGIGIPMAAGAATACPDRKVVATQADGSAMYTIQGLWTQARENLDIVTVVFSNRTYAILNGEMRGVGVNQVGLNARRMLNLDDPALDFVSIARGMGVEAARADTADELVKQLDGAMGRRGPFLIEAVL